MNLFFFFFSFYLTDILFQRKKTDTNFLCGNFGKLWRVKCPKKSCVLQWSHQGTIVGLHWQFWFIGSVNCFHSIRSIDCYNSLRHSWVDNTQIPFLIAFHCKCRLHSMSNFIEKNSGQHSYCLFIYLVMKIHSYYCIIYNQIVLY